MSRGYHWVVEPASRVKQCRFQVIGFEVRQLFENLFRVQASSVEVEHVGHADAHAADAGAAAALLEVDRDSFKQVRHTLAPVQSEGTGSRSRAYWVSAAVLMRVG